jgi:hypothetical protein
MKHAITILSAIVFAYAQTATDPLSRRGYFGVGLAQSGVAVRRRRLLVVMTVRRLRRWRVEITW